MSAIAKTGQGAIIYSDKTGWLNGNFATYGAERTDVGNIHTTSGAGAGGGPVLGFFTGSVDGFKGETRNITLDVLGAAIRYSENDSGWGLSAGWGGNGFGLGSYIRLLKNPSNESLSPFQRAISGN